MERNAAAWERWAIRARRLVEERNRAILARKPPESWLIPFIDHMLEITQAERDEIERDLIEAFAKMRADERLKNCRPHLRSPTGVCVLCGHDEAENPSE